MKFLLDNCVDVRLAKLLPEHEVRRARQMGWCHLSNGQLAITLNGNLPPGSDIVIRP